MKHISIKSQWVLWDWRIYYGELIFTGKPLNSFLREGTCHLSFEGHVINSQVKTWKKKILSEGAKWPMTNVAIGKIIEIKWTVG